ncbi:sensor histidine kinase [Sporosarcina thermotolerans]|uniref:histidine kinase n=2 Tax=Sporosarcina thermotolerans TaxID=633404 RepID=A0AAW9A9E4_9BACL|nr:sensor histidine kinase [Sporosarcina thermotolerans]MDW0116530.1 sensor histidine kinase [Sporosarcina thermotolerans]
MMNRQKRRVENPHLQPTFIINFKMRMILLVGVLVIAIITGIGIYIGHFISNTMEEQVGNRALGVAESVALIPELAEAFKHNDPASIINPLVSPIQKATKAEFIVVGNTSEIRYAHPLPEKIGKKMVGEDNERALIFGESYVSKAVGSLGSSVRAKVPVYLDGQIVGVVSVGFLVNDIQSIIKSYNIHLWIVLLNTAIVAIIGAILIASYIKKVLFGLEPEEIAHLLIQKDAILQSTHEGIIAVNQNGMITMINFAAQRLLFNQVIHSKNYEGMSINDLSAAKHLLNFLRDNNDQIDQEILIGNTIVFANKMPIYDNNSLSGTVFTFRNKTEIDLLTKELRSIKQYTNALRAQTHEFSNKLYTILGLLQLDKKEEAISYIQQESMVQKNWIRLVIQKVSDPKVSGLLLGKINQASELGIELTIQEDSILETYLNEMQSEALLTAIGNLIDNAMDAVKKVPPTQRKIAIFFTDIGNDIIFEIDDSGAGVPPQYMNRIFEQGFTSKEGEHGGFGLSLTKQLVERLDGELYLEEGDLGGASFVLSMPKEVDERRKQDA